MESTTYAHIVLREVGVPVIEGVWIKVVYLAEAHIDGVSAEDLVSDHPPLALGQVYSALAYYYDHKTEMDRLIDERRRLADELEVEMRARNADFYARARSLQAARLNAKRSSS